MLQTLMEMKILGCFGCLSGLLALVVAAVCLVVLLTVLDIDLCALWLIGEPLCEIF
jgi:hypothetical protein